MYSREQFKKVKNALLVTGTMSQEAKFQQLMQQAMGGTTKPANRNPDVKLPPLDRTASPRQSNNGDGTNLRKSLESEIPPSRIPLKYYQTELNPIPNKLGESGNTAANTYNKDSGEWSTVWFPSAFPTGRREVQQLAKTFDLMLEEIKENQEDDVEDDTEGTTRNTLTFIEKEQQVYDIVMNEITRQVMVECAERGRLLSRVTTRYRQLFAKVPGIIMQLQSEIDSLVEANKSLRNLLQRFMEEKTGLETETKERKVELSHISKTNDALQAEIDDMKHALQSAVEEKERALDELRRTQESLSHTTAMNKELTEKDAQSKQIISKLTGELEQAISKLYHYESKEMAHRQSQIIAALQSDSPLPRPPQPSPTPERISKPEQEPPRERPPVPPLTGMPSSVQLANLASASAESVALNTSTTAADMRSESAPAIDITSHLADEDSLPTINVPQAKKTKWWNKVRAAMRGKSEDPNRQPFGGLINARFLIKQLSESIAAADNTATSPTKSPTTSPPSSNVAAPPAATPAEPIKNSFMIRERLSRRQNARKRSASASVELPSTL